MLTSATNLQRPDLLFKCNISTIYIFAVVSGVVYKAMISSILHVMYENVLVKMASAELLCKMKAVYTYELVLLT